MAIREPAIALLRREDFRIVQLSIEGTHVHLLVEAHQRARGTGAAGRTAPAGARRLNGVTTARRRAAPAGAR
jgi:REP element-mobilizing transposase RayT